MYGYIYTTLQGKSVPDCDVYDLQSIARSAAQYSPVPCTPASEPRGTIGAHVLAPHREGPREARKRFVTVRVGATVTGGARRARLR